MKKKKAKKTAAKKRKRVIRHKKTKLTKPQTSEEAFTKHAFGLT